MPTVIGSIFFVLGLYCFLFKEDWLVGLLVISVVFEAASAINFGDRGLQPYYVVSLFLIGRAVYRWCCRTTPSRRMPQEMWLLLFTAICVASALVLPVAFAGIPVYDPKVGIDEGFFVRLPLHLGLNNYVQAAFLLWHVLTAYAILGIKTPSRRVYNAYLWTFYILFVIVAAESVCQLVDIPFPHALLLNNPGYLVWGRESEVAGMRNPGTFSEPSVAGGFLAMYVLGFLARYLEGKREKLRVIASLGASGLVTSGGSLLTIGLATPFLLLKYFPFRFPWFINLPKAKRLVLVVGILAIPALLIIVGPSGYTETLLANTASKGESLSFINRTAADVYALQLVVRTDGLGVGMGSNRASSLVTTLLSNVGVLGFLVFAIYLLRLFGNLTGVYAWLKWGAAALLINMSIGIPDVTMPMLWLPILLAIQFSSSDPGGVDATRDRCSSPPCDQRRAIPNLNLL